MRRLTLLLPVLLLAAPAHAATPQVTDPAGDANGSGVVAPVSLAPFDIRSVRWWADTSYQRVTLTFTEAPGDGRFWVTFATPSCATTTMQWRSGETYTYLEGCKPRHRRWYAPPVVSGTSMTFAIPRRDLPSWVAAGTTLTKLGSEAAPFFDLRTAELHPVVDTAYADVKYVVGS